MKIGIITLLDEKNYGNRWQNFAMNSLLKSIGIETENLYFWIRNCERLSYREIIKRHIPIRIAYFFHAISSYEINDLITLKKVIKFYIFTKKYMDSHIIMANSFEEIKETFDSSLCDYYAVGSDQVWNPYYIANPIYFLQFIDKKEKRLSFMASFGCDVIPENQINNYRKWLSDMRYISVREPSGIKIIHSLINISVDQFLDPTLLLDKDVWIKLCRRPKYKDLPERYAVSFMFNNDTERIEQACNNFGLKLIRLNDKKDKRCYCLNPNEVLYLLRNAALVFTDSFHIMALSIKFNRQFYVLKREGFEYMFGRLKETLEQFNLEKCIYTKEREIILNPISEKEYIKIERICYEQRERFINKVCSITNLKLGDRIIHA